MAYQQSAWAHGEIQLDGMRQALTSQQKFIQMINDNPKMSADDKRQLIDKTYYTMILIAHAFYNVSVVIRSTLLTIRTPEHLLGRVSAVNQIFIGSSNEIGEFESGVAARLLGAVRAVMIGGIITLGVVGVTAWKTPDLRKLDDLS